VQTPLLAIQDIYIKEESSLQPFQLGVIFENSSRQVFNFVIRQVPKKITKENVMTEM